MGPKEAAAFCLNHPEVKVIFAHFGGGLWIYEMMPEMKLALKNAYYDTAAAPFFMARLFLKPSKRRDWPESSFTGAIIPFFR